MPRCYMVKKSSHRHDADGPPPCSPTEASVAPPCYNPEEHSALTESRPVEYAELSSRPFAERSAADTEAAHELLSLAHSVPPLPPAAVLTVLHTPEPPLQPPPAPPPPPPILPIYTYSIQPTNIYIITEEPPEPLYHAVHAFTPFPAEYAAIEPNVNYITYQSTAEPPLEYRSTVLQPLPDPIVLPEPLSEPETAPLPEPEVQVEHVRVIEHTSKTEISVQTDPISDSTCESDPEPASPVQSPVKGSIVRLPTTPKEKPAKYDCNECGKQYATSSNLSRHKQTHRSLDSLAARRCPECGKVYVSMPALAMHVLTHRMGHICRVCGKQFSRPWLLRGHLRSHTGERPYNCESCGKAFADRSNLRAHLQTHSTDKKYECSRCHKTFALKSYLTKHQEATCVRSEAGSGSGGE